MKSKWRNEWDRIYLFEQVWDVPLENVASRFSLSVDELIKRCAEYQVPVPIEPLSDLNRMDLRQRRPKYLELQPMILPYIDYISDSECVVEFRKLNEFDEHSLSSSAGLDFITTESTNILYEWCKCLVPLNSIKVFNQNIIDHKNEMEYRRKRDEEYPIESAYNRLISFRHRFSNSKIEYRNNKCVIPITTSIDNATSAYTITENILRLIDALGGKLKVSDGSYRTETFDQAYLEFNDIKFSFKLDEKFMKQRKLNTKNTRRVESMQPSYKLAPTGSFIVKFEQIKEGRFGSKDSIISKSEFEITNEVSQWLQNIAIYIIGCVIREKVDRYISEYKHFCETVEKEIIEERKMKTIEKEKMNILRQQNKATVIGNISIRIEELNRVNRIKEFINQLNVICDSIENNDEVECIRRYIRFLESEIETNSPLSGVLSDSRLLE